MCVSHTQAEERLGCKLRGPSLGIAAEEEWRAAVVFALTVCSTDPLDADGVLEAFHKGGLAVLSKMGGAMYLMTDYCSGEKQATPTCPHCDHEVGRDIAGVHNAACSGQLTAKVLNEYMTGVGPETPKLITCTVCKQLAWQKCNCRRRSLPGSERHRRFVSFNHKAFKHFVAQHVSETLIESGSMAQRFTRGEIRDVYRNCLQPCKSRFNVAYQKVYAKLIAGVLVRHATIQHKVDLKKLDLSELHIEASTYPNAYTTQVATLGTEKFDYEDYERDGGVEDNFLSDNQQDTITERASQGVRKALEPKLRGWVVDDSLDLARLWITLCL